MKQEISDDLVALLDRSKIEIQKRLVPAAKLSNEQKRRILRRYVAAIEGNFIPWMAAASITSRSMKSRFATDENLWDELAGDHPGMLRSFAKSAGAEPDSEDFRAVEESVAAIRKQVAELSGVKSIALMAFLENTSSVFIPYLAQLATDLGSDNLTYTDLHGEADIEHATLFLEALSAERTLEYFNADEQILSAIESAQGLINSIFRDCSNEIK